ncbi:MAG: ZIP family metal transporter [Betaproteobacteria bacterium]|nr:ZIP family metal transporter [Betaproteobacteria bacterium]
MSTLAWIIAMSALGGALSICAAAAAVYSAGTHRVTALVSYAIGAMLGAVFLEILPHALEHGDPETVAVAILFGILAFFILEKLVLWRHCHQDHCEAHEVQETQHDHGRSGLMVLIGDTFHNFVDGILIATAFLQSTELGIVTALAIIAHEIPQELGDFVVLLHSGFSRAKAFAFNLLSSMATVVGGTIAYFALSKLEGWSPYMLSIAVASMLYVAIADLIPSLHKRAELHATVQQVSLILLGILSIWGVGRLLGAHG